MKLWPLRQTTDEETIEELCWAGLDEDDINPELIRMAKRNRFGDAIGNAKRHR